jgi:hypothetical protein
MAKFGLGRPSKRAIIHASLCDSVGFGTAVSLCGGTDKLRILSTIDREELEEIALAGEEHFFYPLVCKNCMQDIKQKRLERDAD